MSNLTNFVINALKSWVPQVTTVRFRYFADKKRCVRAFGYKDPIDQKGLLARTTDAKPVTEMPIYRPVDSWSKKKALFGQNDYIDILGNGELPLKKVMYNVPSWLRGVKGNELQILIRKKKMLKHGIFPIARPTKWKQLDKRIHYLWRFMNRKTKTYMEK